ncbi:MAG: hypothetical protein Q9219_004380 [cf. Caloplaca sp. 3 TL-2023]
MIFHTGRRSLLILSSLVLVVVANAIPSPANALTPSRCDTAGPTLGSDQPVDPVQHFDWRGQMAPMDCRNAESLFRHTFATYDMNKPMTFWSRLLSTKPQGDNFALPYGTKYQSCTFLLRMAKDFGNNVLPLRYGGFLNVSQRKPQATFRGNDILWVLDDMRRMGESFTKPIWTTGFGVGGEAVMMFIPSDSVMARRWALDINQRTVLFLQGSVSAITNDTDSTASS